jgi:serine phosphatase RsbU (regulator of sigma subunit)
MKYLFSIIVFLFTGFTFSQVNQRQVDSLKNVITSDVHDSVKIMAMSDLNWTYAVSDPGKSREYALSEIQLSHKLGPLFKAQAYNDLAISYARLIFHDSALFYNKKAYELRKAAGRKDLMASSLSKIATAYMKLSNYQDALKANLEALRIYEELKDDRKLGILYGNIGQVYEKLNLYALSTTYNEKALSISRKLGDEYSEATCLFNLVIPYLREGDTLKALNANERAGEIYEKFGDAVNLAAAYNGRGFIYGIINKNKEARIYYNKAIELAQQTGNKGVLLYIHNLSGIEMKEKNFTTAEKLSLEVLRLTPASNPDQIARTYANLAIIYANLGRGDEANNYMNRYFLLRDSLFTSENSAAIAKMQTLYETEKQGLQIENLEKERTVQTAEIKKRNATIIGIACGLGLAIILVFVVFRSYKQNKKASAIITLQKQQAEMHRDKLQSQNIIIEEKKKEILDSINYAKRIQEAILPPMKEVREHLPESFILYQPKDIVAGDFYWMSVDQFEEEGSNVNSALSSQVYIAAADCTGHGVPGAFMSLLGKENLDKALTSAYSPGKILEELNRNIKNALKQNTLAEATRDGMDIALLKLEKNQLTYSGANRPLWIKRKNKPEMEEIKATKFAIGGFTANDQEFTEHEVKLEKGDTLYLFTDGYPDQFGGEKQKKLTTKRFREILLSISDQPMHEQKDHLGKFMTEWCGGVEQVDDILVIGIRV